MPLPWVFCFIVMFFLFFVVFSWFSYSASLMLTFHPKTHKLKGVLLPW